MTQFLHQKIAQQKVQSVCRECLAVVATASHRVQLEPAERAHVCPVIPCTDEFYTEWQLPHVA